MSLGPVERCEAVNVADLPPVPPELVASMSEDEFAQQYGWRDMQEVLDTVPDEDGL